jgi:hypothetical protein
MRGKIINHYQLFSTINQYKSHRFRCPEANFQADGADGGSGAPRSAAKRLRKMDDLDKSRSRGEGGFLSGFDGDLMEI